MKTVKYFRICHQHAHFEENRRGTRRASQTRKTREQNHIEFKLKVCIWKMTRSCWAAEWCTDCDWTKENNSQWWTRGSTENTIFNLRSMFDGRFLRSTFIRLLNAFIDFARWLECGCSQMELMCMNGGCQLCWIRARFPCTSNMNDSKRQAAVTIMLEMAKVWACVQFDSFPRALSLARTQLHPSHGQPFPRYTHFCLRIDDFTCVLMYVCACEPFDEGKQSWT